MLLVSKSDRKISSKLAIIIRDGTSDSRNCWALKGWKTEDAQPETQHYAPQQKYQPLLGHVAEAKAKVSFPKEPIGLGVTKK